MTDVANQAPSPSNALLSVYDKKDIEPFAAGLVDLNFTVFASGGTKGRIQSEGIPVTDVSELVGRGSILGHRVVTLSQEVSAGLLADKNSEEDMAEMEQLGWPIIDLVCVDPYPLEEAIAKPDATDQSVIKDTDIGGPTLLRAAAKGRRIVLSVAEQRQQVLEWLRAGKPDEQQFLLGLAKRAVYEVARYTAMEAQYWNGDNALFFVGQKAFDLKYGENPKQQPAATYRDDIRTTVDPLDFSQFAHVKGWEHSMINELDINRSVRTLNTIVAGFERNFDERPAVAIGVKHENACGAGVAETLLEAVQKMLEGDTRAIHGGVVTMNGVIDKEIAQTLMSYVNSGEGNRLLDGVVGTDITDEALEILKRGKLRVVTNPALANLSEATMDKSRQLRQLRGGMIKQPNDTFVLDLNAEYLEQHGELSEQQKRDVVLAAAICRNTNSNTITMVKDGMLIGNGAGQQDRVGAGQLALTRTSIELPIFDDIDGEWLAMTVMLDKHKIAGAAVASDSFFPFSDGPELLARAGVGVIFTSWRTERHKELLQPVIDSGVAVIYGPDEEIRAFSNHS